MPIPFGVQKVSMNVITVVQVLVGVIHSMNHLMVVLVVVNLYLH